MLAESQYFRDTSRVLVDQSTRDLLLLSITYGGSLHFTKQRFDRTKTEAPLKLVGSLRERLADSVINGGLRSVSPMLAVSSRRGRWDIFVIVAGDQQNEKFTTIHWLQSDPVFDVDIDIDAAMNV